jgi:hypothetical protein
MAAINSGSILLSKVVLKTEATIGTAPSFTSGGRRLAVDPTGYLNAGLTVDDQSDRSVGLLVKAIAQRTTVTSKMPTISLNEPAVPVNELPIWLSGVQYFGSTALGSASATALGLAGTANVWDFNYVLSNGTSGTAIPAAKSFAVVATGGNNNPGTEQYLLNYILPTKISLKAAADGLTSASIDAFGQTLSKDTTVLADALPTDVYNLAGRLWRGFYYASAAAFGTDAGTASAGTALLSGGSAFSYLEDWSLDISTPNQAIAYQAGSLSFTGHSQFAAPLLGELSLTVSGGTDAIAQIYDKYQAGTPSYWRLSWTDGTRQVDILACVIWTDVTPLASDTNGITQISAKGIVNYDTTAGAALRIRVISDTLSTLP